VIALRRMLLALWLVSAGLGQAPSQASLPETACGQKFHIHVYNLAKVSPETLDRAIDLAQSIFAKAAVETYWERGSADAAEAHFTDMTGSGPAQRLKADDRGYLAVKIMRGEPANAFPGALGFALPFAHAGPHAIVFYDRIEGLLPAVPGSVARILGHALAHEAGHALLETAEHSQNGLMKSRYSRADFQRIAVGLLEFSPEQSLALQNNAQRRAALTGSPPPDAGIRGGGCRPDPSGPGRAGGPSGRQRDRKAGNIELIQKHP
jgi:hypothetical protein